MNKLILAGAAALAIAIPAVAQETMTTTTTTSDSRISSWPADRQTSYTAWPETYRTYYWTLTPSQQEGWWMLTDEQRSQIYAMPAEQRTTTWTAVERQMASRPSANASVTAQAATTGAMTASTMEPGSVSTAVRATTPSASMTKDYPLCSRAVTDSCINPREAGKNYGNRPLNYWPGRPASEIPGKKPQN